jgi:hypothetical protein
VPIKSDRASRPLDPAYSGPTGELSFHSAGRVAGSSRRRRIADNAVEFVMALDRSTLGESKIQLCSATEIEDQSKYSQLQITVPSIVNHSMAMHKNEIICLALFARCNGARLLARVTNTMFQEEVTMSTQAVFSEQRGCGRMYDQLPHSFVAPTTNSE